jgi:hypothetical protein
VVLVETAGEILRGRRDLDEVGRAPGAPEGDRWLVEQRIDVHRLVRLAGPALLLLPDEPDDRRVALGEGPLVGAAGRRGGRADTDRPEGEQAQQPEPG